MPMLEVRLDGDGYIYLIDSRGFIRYLLADVPGCSHYGKVKMGEPEKEHLDNDTYKGVEKKPRKKRSKNGRFCKDYDNEFGNG